MILYYFSGMVSLKVDQTI